MWCDALGDWLCFRRAELIQPELLLFTDGLDALCLLSILTLTRSLSLREEVIANVDQRS